MLKWAKGFGVGISLGIICLLTGIIAVQHAMIGGYEDGLNRWRRNNTLSSYGRKE